LGSVIIIHHNPLYSFMLCKSECLYNYLYITVN
jgi:hypothetical protein